MAENQDVWAVSTFYAQSPPKRECEFTAIWSVKGKIGKFDFLAEEETDFDHLPRDQQDDDSDGAEFVQKA